MSIRARLLTSSFTPSWKVWIALKCFNLLTTIINRCGCWIETEPVVQADDLYPIRGEA